MNEVKGQTFELDLHLCLQQMYPNKIVVPQGKLFSARKDQKNVYLDSYVYDEGVQDGEIFDAKWKNSLQTIAEDAQKILDAAVYSLNSGKNTAEHVNINTERKRKIHIICHEKLDGYYPDIMDYYSLEELTKQGADREDLEVFCYIDQKLEGIAVEENLKLMLNYRDVFFNIALAPFFGQSCAPTTHLFDTYISKKKSLSKDEMKEICGGNRAYQKLFSVHGFDGALIISKREGNEP